MTIIPTLSLAIAMALPFLVALLGLNFILFRPVLRYLDERDEAVHTARHEADHLQDEVAKSLATLDKRLAAARDEVATLRNQSRARATEEAAGILAGARSTAQKKVDEAVKVIVHERDQAAGQLRPMAEALANDIVHTVLDRGGR